MNSYLNRIDDILDIVAPPPTPVRTQAFEASVQNSRNPKRAPFFAVEV